ncbi:hypothetical protein DPMN_071231 [Dreissena polymorpha]|uniref:Gag protein n=1 Tax=Dreissena polymorpha TaxID=45954 RepID=A0A9D4BVL5_DREPO|nr:hypothetical protein DPMN_071231 [Dreissena polymorpha]
MVPAHNTVMPSFNNSRTSHLKLKPQNYSGDNDLQHFLIQFELTSDINRWSYKEKSLYLATVLTGMARSLLCEMTDLERRDYQSIGGKLKARFGNEHKSEVFRTQLKSRFRNRNETIPELAQSIRKMTRQAYPTANIEVIEALALDSFIDALDNTDIRLRLREVSPKNIFEAEQIAVKMEAHRLADRQRNGPDLNVQTSQNSDHTRQEITQSSSLRHAPNNNKHTDKHSSSWGPKSMHDRNRK